MPDKHYQTLKEDIEEFKRFQKKGVLRIRDYYDDLEVPSDTEEKFNSLEDAPHEILKNTSSKLIALGFEFNKESKRKIDSDLGVLHVENMLLGIGTEILLEAVLLKENSKWFIENFEKLDSEESPKTPPFDKMRDKLISILEKELSREQKDRLKDIFILVKEMRNNAVHFNFHHTYNPNMYHEICKLLSFLFQKFFPDNPGDVLDILEEWKERTDNDLIMDYKPIELPKVGE